MLQLLSDNYLKNSSNNLIMNVKEFAPALLRYGLAIVYVYFAVQQLMAPSAWAGLVPSFLPGVTMIYINASFEIIAALLLALGIWVKPVSALLAIHLALITVVLWPDPSSVRDFGLTVATIVTFLTGKDKYCLR